MGNRGCLMVVKVVCWHFACELQHMFHVFALVMIDVTVCGMAGTCVRSNGMRMPLLLQ